MSDERRATFDEVARWRAFDRRTAGALSPQVAEERDAALDASQIATDENEQLRAENARLREQLALLGGELRASQVGGASSIPSLSASHTHLLRTELCYDTRLLPVPCASHPELRGYHQASTA